MVTSQQDNLLNINFKKLPQKAKAKTSAKKHDNLKALILKEYKEKQKKFKKKIKFYF